MAAMTLADDLAGLHVERRKQRRGAVAAVVVRAALDLPGPHRQQRLRAIQRLDLRLLVDTQHQRPVRRVQVQADDVAHLLDEQRILGELERLAAVRLQREGAPDAADVVGSARSSPPSRACSSASRPAASLQRVADDGVCPPGDVWRQPSSVAGSRWRPRPAGGPARPPRVAHSALRCHGAGENAANVRP